MHKHGRLTKRRLLFFVNLWPFVLYGHSVVAVYQVIFTPSLLTLKTVYNTI